VKPKIVCLCGSTRFREAFELANFNETLAGNIVLTVGCYTHAQGLFGLPFISSDLKTQLDELHLRKIDLADEVLVLNKDGYIGDSTTHEIKYAKSHDKPIRYLEQES